MKTRMNKAKILAIGLIALIGLWGLDQIVNSNRSDDPTEVVSVLEKEKYYNQGLPEGVQLSDRPFYENDNYRIYRDRILIKTDYLNADDEFLTRSMRKLKQQMPTDVNLYIVSMPNRAIFEDDMKDQQEHYQQFYMRIEEAVKDIAQVIDLREIFDKHKDEYIFYRTEDAITSRGAYYAVEQIKKSLGIENTILLKDYYEYMYTSFKGNLIQQITIDHQLSQELDEEQALIIGNIMEDRTYYYVLPETKDMAQMFIKNEEEMETYKSPVFIKSGVGNGVILYSNKFSHAIIEGDGLAESKQDKTLLYIADTSGQELIPYLANYYEKVYYIHLNWNKSFGTGEQELQQLVEDYRISDVLYFENAAYFANDAYSVAMRNLYNEE